MTYEVENFSLDDECVQRVHNLLDGRGVIPPVHVENVEIRSAQLLERSFYGHIEGLGVVTRVVDLVSDIVATMFETARILSRISTSR
jgi:hypothetical protein